MRAHALAFALVASGLPLAAMGQTWRISPSITLAETWSDNLLLANDAAARSGWLTEVVPGLRLNHLGSRLIVDADYRYHRAFASGDIGDSARNFLNSFASYELVEKSLWLEGRGNITQERRSAFGGTVVPDAPGPNSNRVETDLYSLSPVWRGGVSDMAVYQVRLGFSALRAERVGMDTHEILATIRNPAGFSRFGWSIDFSALRTRSDSFDTLDDRRIRGSLIYAPMPQVHVSLVAGMEETDFAGVGNERHSIPGLGLEWSPGPRTQFAAVAQRRFFGTGHLATFRHRTAQTAWLITSRNEATVLSSTLGSSALTLQTLMGDLLAASVPDPVARAEAIRNRLAEFGAAPTSISTGFLTERPFLNRGVDAAVALFGVRNSLTLGMLGRQRTSLLGSNSIADSFAQSETIKERGYTAAVTHRLSPLTSMTFSSARIRTVGVSSPDLVTDQDLQTLFLTTQLGTRTSATLGIRRVGFDSTRALGYEERAIFASISFHL